MKNLFHTISQKVGSASVKKYGAIALNRTEDGRWMGYGLILAYRNGVVTMERKWQG